ncbi:MAG: tyrosine-type recombinase/integrase, partial [Flavobacteriaceae bacterium]
MNWETALENFKNYLKIERNLSDNTISSYLFDIKKLIFFLKKNSLKTTPNKITADIAKKFFYDTTKKIKTRSQARIISGLRRFFEFLILEEIIKINPMDNIETPRIGLNLPNTLTIKEIDLIISKIY